MARKFTGPRCMQCGKPAAGRLRKDVGHTDWCETHFPTIYQLRRKAHKPSRWEELAREHGWGA